MTTFRRALLARTSIAACLAATALPAHAQESETGAREPVTLPSITVLGQRPYSPAVSNIDLAATPPEKPHSDSGDYLRSVPGIAAARIGGHGLDIVIRGQSINQLNVTTNGATTYGGCANRMDPPTAYNVVESFDEVEIVRGYQSVLNGPGGSGGSVDFRHTRPQLGPDLSVEGDLAAGYNGNGSTRSASAYALTGTDQAYARLTASAKDAGNYEDGSGKKVRSSFEETQAGLTLGFTPGDATHAYLTYNQTRILDAVFAGTGMDSPDSKAKTWNAGIEQDFDGSPVTRMEANIYKSDVDHVMDNYSLRTPAAMFMRIDVASDTYGATLKTDFDLGGQELRTAVEYRHYERESATAMGMSQPMLAWTQTVPYGTEEYALALETTFDLAETTRLITGVRYDHVEVDFGDVTRATGVMTPSPSTLYLAYYGYDAEDRTENNFGGLARLEFDVDAATTLYGTASRSVRTADAVERSNFATNWIGNPRLDPEKHHQLEAGVTTAQDGWNVEGSVYVNRVTDYILRDSARGQDGILVTNTAVDVERNVDALLAGVELRGGWDIAPGLSFEGDATYTYGQDLDTHDALPQIPPLQGSLNVNWQALEDVKIGSTLRYALRQTRVDTDATTGTGRDVGKTPGYAVFDLTAEVTMLDPLTVSFGATNLFDVDYANHLNKTNAYDASEVQVNEPGRSLFVKARLTF